MPARRDSRRALLSSVFVVAAFASGAEAKPQYTLIHSFAGEPNDGAISYADVQLDSAGNIYGTTHNGGAHDVGSIYRIAPDGTVTLLHSFALGDNLGYNPYGGVTIDPKTGDLYGTTEFGGPSDAGVIWKLTAGTFSVLHAFDDTHDGRQPRWHLVRDARGDLYGVALFGGANNDGTVFRYGANGRFTLLHTFAGGDGNNPVGRLDRDKAGNFYGVTFSGGAHNWGTAYKISASGKFTSLHSFTNDNDGGFPEGGVQHDQAGNLYGTNASGTANGYGTVFKVANDGSSFSTLYTFTGGKDGGAPFGDLLRTANGNLYGTTSQAGGGDCQNGCGTVFELNAKGKFKVLHHFAGGTVDGGQLDAGLTRGKGGVLYGATPYYGAGGFGTVFSVNPK